MAIKNATASVAGVATVSSVSHRLRNISVVVAAGLSTATVHGHVLRTASPKGVATVSVARPRMHRYITAAAHGSAQTSANGWAVPWSVLDSTSYEVSVRVLIADGDGTLRDYSSQGGYNWIDSIQVDANIDQPVSQATVNLRRDIIDSTGTALSLSPLRTDSTLNRNAALAFAPAVDVGRTIQILAATTAYGVSPTTNDWQNIFTGAIDSWDVSANPMVLMARDQGGLLVDAFILPAANSDGGSPSFGPTYGSGPGVPIETVMQQIMDDALGVAAPTLYCPVSPDFLISPGFSESLQSVMDALQQLAGIIGWDVRYIWDRGSASWRLTLQPISRTKLAPDRVLQPNRYLQVQQLLLANTDVRNVVTVWYNDSTIGTTALVTVQDNVSIAQFGERPMVVDETGGVSPINTLSQATIYANNILADLSAPLADQIIIEHFDWTVFLNALQLYKANGIQYNTDQSWAVISYKHNITSTQARTTVEVRGAPCGRYLNWLSLASTPAAIGATPSFKNFRILSEDAFSVTYAWSLGDNTAEAWATMQVLSSPVPADPWTAIAALVEPLSVNTFVVEKPPAGSFTYAQIEPRSAGLVAGEIQRVIVAPGQAPLEYGASPQGTVSIDTNGNWSASLDGPQQVLSYRWLSSTSGYPDDATTAGGGAIINGRTFTVTDGGTLDFGQTVYITAVPYPSTNALGDAGQSVHLRGSYQSYTPTKTVAYSAGSFTPKQSTITSYGSYFGPSVQSAIAAPFDYIGQCIVLIPDGTTLTNATQDLYFNDTGGVNADVSAVSMNVLRVDAAGSGGTTSLGSASITNLLGWQSASVPLSETATGKSYLIWSDFLLTAHGTSSIHDVTTAYGGSFYATYQMGDPSTNI